MYFFLSTIIFSTVSAGTNSLSELQSRLKKIDNFYVHFIQSMYCSDGSTIEISRGELWVKKPNLFHWHVVNPKEFFLISDGKTVWFYVPLIKQVTAYCLENIVNNIVFRLLFDNDESKWNDYSVMQEKNWFYLTHNHSDTDFKKCSIKITDCGEIEQFSIYEEHKQCVDYVLFDYNIQSTDINKFRFLISEDVQLDDQRS